VPADIAATDRMIATIKKVYERYGFDPLETPMFEYTETLGKFLPDTDRPNAGVFSLMDDDEQWMSLRYDLTAPLARYFAQNYDKLPKPFRSYRAGYVFRNEKPGPGRFRQFMQFDADTVGAAGPEADAEMCMMMADTMDALGLAGKYVVKVNNRKVFDSVLDAIGVDGAAQKLAVLRSVDKMDKFPIEEIQKLLGAGRLDESGDYTKGAGLNEAQINVVCRLTAPNRPDMALSSDDPESDAAIERAGRPKSRQNWWNLDWWRHDIDYFLGANGFSTPDSVLEAFETLFQIEELLWNCDYNSDRVKVDLSVVRGLEYYTGPVFEVQLTFQVPNDKGQPVVFGSVGGGGRYDGLVSRFRSEPVPATGFSIGVSRLANALKMTGLLNADENAGPVVILVLDRDPAAIADYQKMTSELRRAGIRAEMYLGSSGINAQMKYADRRNAAAAVIVGSNERAEGKVTIKDLAAGAEAAKAIKDNAEYKAAKVGQSVVARADLVAELSKIPAVARMRSNA
jgi:histidyl-tRNA synthetase